MFADGLMCPKVRLHKKYPDNLKIADYNNFSK
jgi:hypothetical protein